MSCTHDCLLLVHGECFGTLASFDRGGNDLRIPLWPRSAFRGSCRCLTRFRAGSSASAAGPGRKHFPAQINAGKVSGPLPCPGPPRPGPPPGKVVRGARRAGPTALSQRNKRWERGRLGPRFPLPWPAEGRWARPGLSFCPRLARCPRSGRPYPRPGRLTPGRAAYPRPGPLARGRAALPGAGPPPDRPQTGPPYPRPAALPGAGPPPLFVWGTLFRVLSLRGGGGHECWRGSGVHQRVRGRAPGR